jgi:hypothetical protein
MMEANIICVIHPKAEPGRDAALQDLDQGAGGEGI